MNETRLLTEIERNELLKHFHSLEIFYYFQFKKNPAYHELNDELKVIALGHDKDDMSLFKEVLFTYLFGSNLNRKNANLGAVATFTIFPNGLEGLDQASQNEIIYNDFKRAFTANIFPLVVKKTIDAAKQEYYAEIRPSKASCSLHQEIVTEEEGFEPQEDGMEDQIVMATSEVPEDQQMSAFISKEEKNHKLMILNKDFDTYLNGLESKVFWIFLRGRVTYEELIQTVGVVKGAGKLLTIQQLRTILNSIQFRYVAFLGYRKFLSDSEITSGLNKYPRICRHFFCSSKVHEVPSTEELKRVFTDYGERKPRVLPLRRYHDSREIEEAMHRKGFMSGMYEKNSVMDSDFIYASKYDFNLRKHDHLCTYFSLQGFGFCHINKETVNLFETTNDAPEGRVA